MPLRGCTACQSAGLASMCMHAKAAQCAHRSTGLRCGAWAASGGTSTALQKAPRPLSQFYLAAFLDSLAGQGYSIFVVRGALAAAHAARGRRARRRGHLVHARAGALPRGAALLVLQALRLPIQPL